MKMLPYDIYLEFLIFCLALGIFAVLTFYVLMGWYFMGEWVIKKINKTR